MKNRRILKKQHGFFDFGLGLALSLIFGGTAVVVESQHNEETALAKQETQIVQPVEEKLAIVDRTVEE